MTVTQPKPQQENGAGLTPIERLTRDITAAARDLSREEARFLVDSYYTFQEQRIGLASQARASEGSGEPHGTIDFFFKQAETVEKQMARALGAWTDGDPLSVWAKSICGIGPVLAAGLLAHIDFHRTYDDGQPRTRTAPGVWRMAGLDPSVTWGKGQKRPWNAKLKVICWRAGESFVKVQNNDKDVYGKLYVARKKLEQERNERGDYAEQAAHTLATKKIGKTTDAYGHYKEGRLPPARIHLRSTRWAVKIFLSHYFDVGWCLTHGTPPPMPYAIAHLEHAHMIEVPNPPDEIKNLLGRRRPDAIWPERRLKVLERDHYECQEPGCSEKDLRVVHLKPRAEAGDGEDNLKTYCGRHALGKGLI